MARLERFHQQQAKKNKVPSSRRWWNLLGEVSEGLNSKPILVGGKRLGFTPKDVGESNVEDFLGALYKDYLLILQVILIYTSNLDCKSCL